MKIESNTMIKHIIATIALIGAVTFNTNAALPTVYDTVFVIQVPSSVQPGKPFKANVRVVLKRDRSVGVPNTTLEYYWGTQDWANTVPPTRTDAYGNCILPLIAPANGGGTRPVHFQSKPVQMIYKGRPITAKRAYGGLSVYVSK
jgi:hypothetical protein